MIVMHFGVDTYEWPQILRNILHAISFNYVI